MSLDPHLLTLDCRYHVIVASLFWVHPTLVHDGNSQSIDLCSGVARAQPMPGHSMGTSLVPRPCPAFSGLQYGNAEATRGVWGMLPQKILEFLSFLGRFWGYFRPYRRLELEHFDNAFATNLRARSVRSL